MAEYFGGGGRRGGGVVSGGGGGGYCYSKWEIVVGGTRLFVGAIPIASAYMVIVCCGVWFRTVRGSILACETGRRTVADGRLQQLLWGARWDVPCRLLGAQCVLCNEPPATCMPMWLKRLVGGWRFSLLRMAVVVSGQQCSMGPSPAP